MMQIYERIKKAREDANLTPGALAGKLGIARTTYLHWEESTPSPEKVMDVARALGLPEYYFFIPPEKVSILTTVENIDNPIDEKPDTHVNAELVVGDKTFLVDAKAITASFERIIEAKEETIAEKEARRQEAREWAERAEAEKKDYLEIFKDYLKEILTNSNKTKDTLLALRTEIVAENREIMETLDQIAGNDPGTTAAKSGKVELAHRVRHQNKGKKANTGKRS
jgi:transcriptional regulator with XRE-family HTH domain